MVKSTLIGVAILAVVFVLLIPLGFLGYAKTAARMAGDQVYDSVPMNLQIERAHDMIGELEPVIEKNTQAIVKEEVAIDRLEREISDMEEHLSKNKDEVFQLQSDLQSGEDIYVYAGMTYTADQVKTDLSNRFERYQTKEATLESLRAIRSARKQGLAAAQRKLDAMQAEKRQLAVQVENLQARMQMVAAQKASSDYQFDEGKMGDVQKLVSNLDTRLEVAERMVHSDTYYPGEIQLESDTSDDIMARVAEHFGQGDPQVEMVAAHD